MLNHNKHAWCLMFVVHVSLCTHLQPVMYTGVLELNLQLKRNINSAPGKGGYCKEYASFVCPGSE